MRRNLAKQNLQLVTKSVQSSNTLMTLNTPKFLVRGVSDKFLRSISLWVVLFVQNLGQKLYVRIIFSLFLQTVRYL